VKFVSNDTPYAFTQAPSRLVWLISELSVTGQIVMVKVLCIVCVCSTVSILQVMLVTNLHIMGPACFYRKLGCSSFKVFKETLIYKFFPKSLVLSVVK